MAKSCKGVAMELVKCLSESDCMKVEKRDYRDCAKEKSPSIPNECIGLRDTYFQCKRSQVDMRSRIREIKDIRLVIFFTCEEFQKQAVSPFEIKKWTCEFGEEA